MSSDTHPGTQSQSLSPSQSPSSFSSQPQPQPAAGVSAGAGAERSFLFVLGSSRADGNTEILARAAAAQLPAGVRQEWVDLRELDLPDFQDGRHENGSWPVGEAERKLRELTLAATDVVLVTPLYWYTVSAQMKRYLDYWSGWARDRELGFQRQMAGRTLWGVTVMAEREESIADGLLITLNNSAGYLRMRFGGVLLGNGSRPGQVRDDERAAVRAKTFFAQEAPLAQYPGTGE
ncbi:flavodoxin family protein [Streptomyces clavuligerus]|uniref:Multimeric flavodoxin WrbA n=1 Tax=Streptomyces clavuligerus TaxID=1901 RepID=D5SJF6_STRCL|nr:NAD(P)H-dependent oxidoreductase [Streptomyces clavuligerus]EFG04049.1 Multimeric flavodoxin WrbA [Streptomyces clavuligerus]MBY6307462.1 NAD(P)H-dependent oxidoreductase [Streptomyces clavuligerus]QCS09978.1 flavodoxin family protein [Streptomyces clavuligerus]WDN56685.1 NAD(P)H-dependent oxidoreductase [Streptomyces clavuligerus]